MEDDNGDERSEIRIDDPTFLFQLFYSDIIAAEIDWKNERFVFYPVNSLSARETKE